MVLHLAVLLLAALVVRPSAVPPEEEPDRLASIVLASRSVGGATTYSSFFSDENDGTSDRAYCRQQDASLQDAEPVGDPLPPDAPAESLLADAGLPRPSGTIAGTGVHGDELVQVPSLTVSDRPRILPGLGDDEILQNDPLRNRPHEPGAPATEVRPFGHVAAGRSFVFLIDRSKSMGGQGLGAIAAAQRELVRELANLEPVHRFQIIAYNQSYSAMSQKGMVAGSDEDRRLAARFLAGVIAAGGTEHDPPLWAALRLRPDVIYVMTDGGDPPLTDPEIRNLTRHNGGRATIHCVHFGSGALQQENHFLRRLARANRGTYSYVDMMQAARPE